MSLQTTLNVSLGWTNTVASTLGALETIQDSATIRALTQLWLNGTIINTANTIYHDRRTLAASASETISMYDMHIDAGSAQKDALGQTIANARIKLLFVQNRSTTAGEILRVFGNGASTGFTSIVAPNTSYIPVAAGGSILFIAPSAAGYAVTATTNELVKFLNTGAASMDYDVLIIGSSA